MIVLRGIIVALGLVALWQIIVRVTGVEFFILPAPALVLRALFENFQIISGHAAVTLTEIVVGLCIGTGLGAATAITMVSVRQARDWMLPVLVASQAIPVFAIAPILVLWLGYGMWSKIAMAVLIIFFPVTATFYDGLRRTNPGWLDLAKTMNASRRNVLLFIRIPAAMPAFGSGLRVATAVAPIGAVVGEWVGSSAGLGRYMIEMNSRTKTPEMFAALLVLAVIAVALYFFVDTMLRRLMPWQPDRLPDTY